MGKRQLSYEDYTIGWVCALSLEQTAAIYMLDERHESLPNSAHDHNAYNLGRVGKHNVVIAGLPKGKADNNNAATVAAQMLSTFHNIRMTLMVGVGGGIPENTRLGDVVISSPTDTNLGVIQWDKGKEGSNGFTRKGCLDGLPTAGLTALANFEADPDTLRTMRSHLRGMRYIPDIDERFLKSKFLEDILFDSDYNHVGGATDCSDCDNKRIVRGGPTSDYPKVHYGLIASGNKKIEDAKRRDQLYEENKNLFCIEMEAAGLMSFRCIVIRGICDYADSHAGKKWQRYAAAAAAACAKTYLGVVPEHEIHRLQPVRASIASDNTRRSGESENSMENAMQYHEADSPPPTPTKFKSPVTSAAPMLEWSNSGAYSQPGGENSQLFKTFMEMMLGGGIPFSNKFAPRDVAALRNFLQSGGQPQQVHVTAEEIGGTNSINRPQTPPLSPKQENDEIRPHSKEGPSLRHTKTDLGSTQPPQDGDLSDPSKPPQLQLGKTFPMDKITSIAMGKVASTTDAVLFEAIEKEDVATIEIQLQNGADLEMVNEFGCTPLWYAVVTDKRSVIQLLLDKGANTEAENLYGQNILAWAVSKGKTDIVEMLGYN